MQSVGILDRTYKSVPIFMIEFLWGPLTPTIKRKLTKSVEIEKPAVTPIRLYNFTYTTILYISMVILSVIVLMIEVSQQGIVVFKEKRSINKFRNMERNVWNEVKPKRIKIRVQYIK